MRKRLTSTIRKTEHGMDKDWLDLEHAAQVEVTSEAQGYPVEGALLHQGERGWRANMPGPQTIRLLFDSPQTIRVIRLLFKEEEVPRTQEFVLRWLPYGGDWKDVVRQQWNFSPPTTMYEDEEYRVELVAATVLELSINPGTSRDARASLERLQLSVTSQSQITHG